MIRAATGDIVWSANGTSEESGFSGSSISSRSYGSDIIKDQKHMWGELYSNLIILKLEQFYNFLEKLTLK